MKPLALLLSLWAPLDAYGCGISGFTADEHILVPSAGDALPYGFRMRLAYGDDFNSGPYGQDSLGWDLAEGDAANGRWSATSMVDGESYLFLEDEGSGMFVLPGGVPTGWYVLHESGYPEAVVEGWGVPFWVGDLSPEPGGTTGRAYLGDVRLSEWHYPDRCDGEPTTLATVTTASGSSVSDGWLVELVKREAGRTTVSWLPYGHPFEARDLRWRGVPQGAEVCFSLRIVDAMHAVRWEGPEECRTRLQVACGCDSTGRGWWLGTLVALLVLTLRRRGQGLP